VEDPNAVLRRAILPGGDSFVGSPKKKDAKTPQARYEEKRRSCEVGGGGRLHESSRLLPVKVGLAKERRRSEGGQISGREGSAISKRRLDWERRVRPPSNQEPRWGCRSVVHKASVEA